MRRLLLFRLAAVALASGFAACGSTSSGPGCTAVAVGLPSTVSVATGHYPFTISTSPSCDWIARTDVSWADVAPGSGRGPATAMLNVSSTSATNPRTVTITINTDSYQVVQSAR